MATPIIVCLCGSTRFIAAFEEANRRETLADKIVLTVGVDFKREGANLSEEDKQRMDSLHFAKIDLAREILVLNIDGYVGCSTAREICYAARQGKRIRFWTLENEPTQAGEKSV